MTTEIMSTAPRRTSISKERGKERENPKMMVKMPKATTDQRSERPARRSPPCRAR